MKGTSRVIMGATLVMVVSLAVVLGLILVLLAELYCSLLLRRRHLRNTSTSTTPQTTTTTIATPSSYSPSQHAPHSPPPPPPPHPFNNVYSQGVLRAPRTFLFPSNNIACMEEPTANANANHIGLVSVPSPLASFISRAPPKQVQEDPLQGTASHDPKSHVGQEQHHHLVYISNPIYENEEQEKASDIGATNTPFETPDTSPSRLEGSGGGGGGGSSDEDDVVVGADKDAVVCVPYTPPLTPMKKLPTEACSVSLRDARSLVGTSASDSRSNNGISSSSSVSPRTSPSW